jgi:DNA replication licensing factor MCM5
VDCYVIIPEESTLVDQQSLKLQELPETVPTGEIPRTFQICVDRVLVNKIAPGTRITLTGIYSVVEQKVLSAKANAASLKIPYIQVLGYKPETNSGRGFNKLFTNEEEEKIRTLSRDPEIYDKISRSIASAIYGSQDIKKALSLLLFGGSRKVLPDKTKLRGDINILLIGDPSTAKSQFLKFIERVAPIAIYTSGKGSSAAGLTASILKDFRTGEFQLEGGAMVLADGGIVCIDEFDKVNKKLLIKMSNLFC